MFKHSLSVLFLLVFATPVFAESPENWFAAEYISNYDGDTATFKIHIWHDQYIIESVRFRDIDTAEIRTKCDVEKRLAYDAKQFTKNVLQNASSIELHNIGEGKYGRTIANIRVDNKWFYDIIKDQKFVTDYGIDKEYCE